VAVSITCDCGNRWEYRGSSGRTQCRRCRARVYITAEQRRSAGLRGANVSSPKRSILRRQASAPSYPEVPSYPDPEEEPRISSPRISSPQLPPIGETLLRMAQTFTNQAFQPPKQATRPVRKSSQPVAQPRPRTVRTRVCPKCATGTAACGLPGCPMP
jgi:hypothetical protein